ncbi:type IV pilus modification PilV family protein [Marinobacter subterrani]|uniref:type IV pilus modification PilV family protein n=1 Tax=Marinobacter subterrani TaxID=1658765 RepID=UPI002356091C|nr:type II secretion system protein [Marinobacter subterrani]
MTGRHSVTRFQSGATLVELVITIVIISVAIAGVVGAFALITGRSADPLNQTRAVALAQIYMDEILSRRYDEDTPVGGSPREPGCTINTEEANRADYDDVDDYNAINNAVPANAEGTALGADYGNFRVSVTVECAGDEIGLPLEEDAKRIDLLVTDPSGQGYSFSAYRANY